MSSVEVRARLVEALRLDLVGPNAGHPLSDERLPGWGRPSNWYLTGFLIPSTNAPEKSGDADEDDDFELVPESAGLAEESNEERKAAKKGYFPSSIGLSFLVPKDCHELAVTVRWGDYAITEISDEEGKRVPVWQRSSFEATIALSLEGTGDVAPHDVPGSGGLKLHVIQRSITGEELTAQIPRGTRSVSVFLVNYRAPEEGVPDSAYVFQAEIEVRGDKQFVARPHLRGARIEDWDEHVADLHYADTPEFATGHGVSADWEVVEGCCRVLRTTWIPSAQVEKTETVDVPGVELSMDMLGALGDGAAAVEALRPLVSEYRTWIESRRQSASSLSEGRRETAEELLRLAVIAADRIERGIAALSNDPDALDAFRVANRAVSRALKKRLGAESPNWRAFQLAFILLNLPGLADQEDPTREIVDLLFFPTGGGKTEAYLGLAAFAMVFRRLRHPGTKGSAAPG